MSGCFNIRATIRRQTETDLGGGRWGEAWATVGSARGRLSPVGGDDPVYAALETAVTLYRFATSSATDLRQGDRIAHPDGRAVAVRQVRRTSSGRRIEAICEDIEDAD